MKFSSSVLQFLEILSQDTFIIVAEKVFLRIDQILACLLDVYLRELVVYREHFASVICSFILQTLEAILASRKISLVIYNE